MTLKMPSGAELTVRAELEVIVSQEVASALAAELRQILEELGLGGSVVSEMD